MQIQINNSLSNVLYVNKKLSALQRAQCDQSRAVRKLTLGASLLEAVHLFQAQLFTIPPKKIKNKSQVKQFTNHKQFTNCQCDKFFQIHFLICQNIASDFLCLFLESFLLSIFGKCYQLRLRYVQFLHDFSFTQHIYIRINDTYYVYLILYSKML